MKKSIIAALVAASFSTTAIATEATPTTLPEVASVEESSSSDYFAAAAWGSAAVLVAVLASNSSSSNGGEELEPEFDGDLDYGNKPNIGDDEIGNSPEFDKPVPPVADKPIDNTRPPMTDDEVIEGGNDAPTFDGGGLVTEVNGTYIVKGDNDNVFTVSNLGEENSIAVTMNSEQVVFVKAGVIYNEAGQSIGMVKNTGNQVIVESNDGASVSLSKGEDGRINAIIVNERPIDNTRPDFEDDGGADNTRPPVEGEPDNDRPNIDMPSVDVPDGDFDNGIEHKPSPEMPILPVQPDTGIDFDLDGNVKTITLPDGKVVTIVDTGAGAIIKGAVDQVNVDVRTVNAYKDAADIIGKEAAAALFIVNNGKGAIDEEVRINLWSKQSQAMKDWATDGNRIDAIKLIQIEAGIGKSAYSLGYYILTGKKLTVEEVNELVRDYIDNNTNLELHRGDGAAAITNNGEWIATFTKVDEGVRLETKNGIDTVLDGSNIDRGTLRTRIEAARDSGKLDQVRAKVQAHLNK